MSGLTTTAEERAMFRAACLSSNNDRVRVARILDDLDTLLAEKERLRAAIASARDLIAAPHHTIAEELAHAALDAALEAP